MTTNRQEALPAPPSVPAGRRRVYCKGWRCGRELTDPDSRLRGYGPECDPDRRHGHDRCDVDQDPIPGL